MIYKNNTCCHSVSVLYYTRKEKNIYFIKKYKISTLKSSNVNKNVDNSLDKVSSLFTGSSVWKKKIWK